MYSLRSSLPTLKLNIQENIAWVWWRWEMGWGDDVHNNSNNKNEDEEDSHFYLCFIFFFFFAYCFLHIVNMSISFSRLASFMLMGIPFPIFLLILLLFTTTYYYCHHQKENAENYIGENGKNSISKENIPFRWMETMKCISTDLCRFFFFVISIETTIYLKKEKHTIPLLQTAKVKWKKNSIASSCNSVCIRIVINLLTNNLIFIRHAPSSLSNHINFQFVKLKIDFLKEVTSFSIFHVDTYNSTVVSQ